VNQNLLTTTLGPVGQKAFDTCYLYTIDFGTMTHQGQMVDFRCQPSALYMGA